MLAVLVVLVVLMVLLLLLMLLMLMVLVVLMELLVHLKGISLFRALVVDMLLRGVGIRVSSAVLSLLLIIGVKPGVSGPSSRPCTHN